MCGVLGIVTSAGREVSVSDGAAMAMRDRMTHRGPDDAGLVRLGGAAAGGGHVLLAHRRLSVLDPTSAGHQPMGTADGRLWLVYNGEIYNDDELRARLAREGVAFSTACDTETLLLAIERWGVEGAVSATRGMFAFGVYDRGSERLTLVRDAMGIKPLYWARASVAGSGFEFVFASEIPAVLAHPAISARHDPLGVSAYLTTIRTTTDDRTLYEGVRIVRPGEIVEVDLRDDTVPVTRRWQSRPLDVNGVERGAGGTREVISESVRLHLRSDVPMCALLSGGLDSSIVCRVAMDELGALRTYCAGARDGTGEGGGANVGGGGSEDFAFAALAARAIGSRHVEVPVTRGMFGERWRSMVQRMGLPLSTPNEVAINEVARSLRADGNIVTLSGEGADELFGGYGGPMSMARFHVERGNHEPGLFQLNSAAWMSGEVKSRLLREEVWRGVEEDAWLREVYRTSFERVAAGVDEREGESGSGGGSGGALEAHLRFQRSINLVGLLQRLDSATMLESVEGRVPFADVVVAAFADRLPMREKYEESIDDTSGSPVSRTKIALREAFAGMLAPEIVERPKASFPLPFQAWVSDQGETIRGSAFLREFFREEAVEGVASNPSAFWAYAWPMANLAMWAERGL